jgi:nucleoside-diphosphate-sugar epimerase
MKETDQTDPIGFYGYTKWIGENMCLMHHRLHGLPITILRLYFPYGPGQQSGIVPLIVHSVREGRPLTIKKRGSPRINPIHMDDCVAAVLAAARKPEGYRVYNLCGDETVSFLDLVHLVERTCERKATILHSEEDPGDLLGDNSRIKRDLNWKPEKQLSEISHMIKGGI